MKHAKVSGYFSAGCLIAAGMMAAPVPALAQSGLGSALAPKTAPTGELLEVSEALGMVRGLDSHIFDAVNRVQFTVQGKQQVREQGSWKEFQTTATVFINFHQAASRVVADRVDGKGTKARSIGVVAGPYAWNEQSPGVGGTPAMELAADRARDIWLTPQGLVYQANLAGPGAVKLGKRDGRTTLSYAINGEPVTVTLDADHRPHLVEASIKHRDLGRTTLTIEYTGYKDFDHYGIFFPSHILARAAGRTVLDANVTAFLTNTYFLFPKPDSIAKLAAKAGK
jgi:hypothetical protein